MSLKVEIKVEASPNDKELEKIDNLITSNIKNEPEVEFVLILPPAILKAEIVENFEENESSQKKNLEFQCPECPKSFDKKINLMHHKRAHKPRVECQICNKYIRHQNLKNHQKRHDAVSRFKCDFCSTGFYVKQEMVEHMWNHRSDKKFKCPQCSQGFNFGSSFKRHLLSHSTDPRPFKCDLCPKSFISKLGLQGHIISIHKEGSEFKCDQCEYAAKLQVNLRMHKRIGTNIFFKYKNTNVKYGKIQTSSMKKTNVKYQKYKCQV